MLRKTIAQAIKKSGESRNQISLNTGIDPTVIHRLVHGGSAGADTLETLCEYLGLELRPKAKKGR